jgi:hypothetical protein
MTEQKKKKKVVSSATTFAQCSERSTESGCWRLRWETASCAVLVGSSSCSNCKCVLLFLSWKLPLEVLSCVRYGNDKDNGDESPCAFV